MCELAKMNMWINHKCIALPAEIPWKVHFHDNWCNNHRKTFTKAGQIVSLFAKNLAKTRYLLSFLINFCDVFSFSENLMFCKYLYKITILFKYSWWFFAFLFKPEGKVNICLIFANMFCERFRHLRIFLQGIFAKMGFRQHKEIKFSFQPLILVTSSARKLSSQ